MINIETLPLDRFTNSEHQNALRSLAMVVKKNTTNEKIKQCAEKLAEAIKEEETIADGHNIDRYTKELNDADTQQTNSCLALRQCLKGYLKVSMKPEKDAAKEILSFMNLCKIEFKGQRDNRTSEIKVFIESMLHRQEHDYMADINLLMLNKIFDDIRKHNKLVYALQTKQEQEQSSLGTYRKRRARKISDDRYDTLIHTIFSYAFMQPCQEYDDLVDVVNALTAEKRKEHNRILAIRRHFKNKATDNQDPNL